MKYIKQDLRHLDTKAIEIVALGDLHIGDNNCDLNILHTYIEYINSKDNVFVIGMGDYINNALKLSKTDVYSAVAPSKEIEATVKILGKIKTSKWLAMTTGNHEYRTAKEAGIDINEFMAYRLGIEEIYNPGMCIIEVRLSNNTYWILLHHGTGGGSTKGGAANKLQRLGYIVPNADVVLMGHTHQSISFWNSCYMVDKKHYTIQKHTQFIVNTGSMLGYQNGYAENMMLPPGKKGNAIISLSSEGKFKNIHARWSL